MNTLPRRTLSNLLVFVFLFLTIIGIESQSAAATSIVDDNLLLCSGTTIVTDPDSVYCIGDTIHLAVTNPQNGTPYQWERSLNSGLSWQSVSGATAATLNVVATIGIVGTVMYRRTFFPPGGDNFSCPKTIQVQNPVAMIVPGVLAELCDNENSTFTSTFTGATIFSYAWFIDNVADGTSATYAFDGTTATSVVKLIATSTFGCNDTTTVTVNPVSPPTAEAGASYATICSTGALTLNGAVIGGGPSSGFSWSSNSGGTFSSPLQVNETTYSPNDADSPVTLTLTVTSVACPNVTDNVSVTVAAPPTAEAGSSYATICSTGFLTLSSAVIGGGANSGFSWSSNSGGTFSTPIQVNQTTYSPNDADSPVTLTLTVTSAACPNVTDNVSITVAAPPTAEVGASYSPICSSSTLTLANAVIGGGLNSGFAWSSNSGGTFTTPGAVNTTVYTPNDADTPVILTLTVTSAACPNVTDNVSITVVPAPTVDAGLPDTICVTSTSALNATASGSPTDFTWTFSSGSVSNDDIEDPVFTPTATQTPASLQVTLTLTVTYASCPNVVDQVIITVKKLPVITEGNDITICADSVADLSGSAQNEYSPLGLVWTAVNGAGAGTFSPPNNNGISQFNPTTVSGSETLTLTATSAYCPPVTANLLVSVVAQPTVINLSNTTLCDDDIVGATSLGNGATSFSWTSNANDQFADGSGLSIPGYTAANNTNAQTTTIVTVVPTNLYCSGTSDAFNIVVNPSPEVTITTAELNEVICSGSEASISPTANVLGSTISWTATGNANIDFSSSGSTSVSEVLTNGGTSNASVNYSFIATAAQCEGVATVATVQVNVLPTVQSITSNPVSICSGETIDISMTLTGSGSFSGSLAVVNSSGTTTIPINTNNSTYLITLSPTDSTEYYFQSLNGSGTLACEAISPEDEILFVEVHPLPFAEFTQDEIAICEGSDASLEISASAGNGPFSGLLSDGTTFTDEGTSFALDVPVDFPGVVIGFENIEDINGCAVTSAVLTDEINITVIDTPSASIVDSPDVLCGNDSLHIEVEGNGNGIVTYELNGGTPQTLTLFNGAFDLNLGTFPTSTGVTFELTQISLPGAADCSADLTETTTIDIIPFPNTEGLSIDTSASPFCQGSQDLEVWIDDNTSGITWSWLSSPLIPIVYNSDDSNALIDIPESLTGFVLLTATATSTNGVHECYSNITEQIFINSANAPDESDIVLYPLNNTLVVLNNDAGLGFQWGQTDEATLTLLPAIGETAQDWIVGTLDTDVFYWVIITDLSNGCSTTSYYNGLAPVEISEEDADWLVPYPNPTSDYLNLSSPFNKEIFDIKVYDMRGSEVYNRSFKNQNRIAIDVRSLAVGSYSAFIRISDGEIKFVRFEVASHQ